MKVRFPAAGLFVLVAVGLTVAAASERGDLVVHEWGTFLAMNGSDGVALDGMYHEEHALPAFVHSRSKDQLKLRSVIVKGETPVIYFYTQRPQQVAVRVDFPGGIWTQWYPQAALVGPALVQLGTPPRPRNGHITWAIDVVPPQLAHGESPATRVDALWNHARHVDAAYVSASDQTRTGAPKEWERFVFYRGLGEAKLPLAMSAHDGRIVAHTTAGVELRHVYVVRVEHGRGAYAYMPALEDGKELNTAISAMDMAMPIDRFADAIAADMAQRLVETGLYEKEARAMVSTWRNSYFKTDGVRVLFVLPQSWTDRYIPLRIDPKPAEMVRVMVGRVELLTPERERRAETAVRDLASTDEGVRERAFATLRDEGRYVEPIVRHTLRTSTDERVQTLARRLLLTDFITELRTSLTHAASGEKLPQNPIYARAQLASLLREVGLMQEARQEGEAVLAALGHIPPPDMRNHDSRHVYRAVARAHEGAGHDAEAVRWYGDFVTFGSRTQTCAGGCHLQTEGPRDMAFFRDWWAGRKFGEYAVKTGEAPQLIAAHEATLARTANDVAAQLSLAYLYEARGDPAAANKMWLRIDP
jgi:hypothetical protein